MTHDKNVTAGGLAIVGLIAVFGIAWLIFDSPYGKLVVLGVVIALPVAAVATMFVGLAKPHWWPTMDRFWRGVGIFLVVAFVFGILLSIH